MNVDEYTDRLTQKNNTYNASKKFVLVKTIKNYFIKKEKRN